MYWGGGGGSPAQKVAVGEQELTGHLFDLSVCWAGDFPFTAINRHHSRDVSLISSSGGTAFVKSIRN